MSNPDLVVKPLISTHTFGFSFHLIADLPEKQKETFTENIKDTTPTANSIQGLGSWGFSDFQPWSSAAAFNEYQYFYKQVLETIYSSEGELSNFGYSYRVFNFSDLNKPREFELIINHNDKDVKVILDIDEIHLSLIHVVDKKYTGVLTVHTSNRKETQSDVELILKINQQARQLYPSTFAYEGRVKAGIGLDLDYVNKNEDGQYSSSTCEGFDGALLGMPKSATFLKQDWQQWLFMPVFDAAIAGKNLDKPIYRPDYKANTSHNDHRTHATIPAVLYQLIRTGFHSMLKHSVVLESGEDFPRIYAVGDARMHVHSYIGSKLISGEIAGAAKKPPFDFSWRDSFPYRAVFVDERWPTYNYAPGLEQKLVQQTDLRWSSYGTLYGFTGYSSIMLSDAYANLGYNGYLVWVFRGAYYTMVQTVLLQRAAIRLLSQEVSRFHTELLDASKKDGLENTATQSLEQQHQKVIKLSESFTRFREKLVFSQVTSQDQGADYYNHLQQAFGIRALLAELEGELRFMAEQSELQYNYQQTVSAARQTAASEKLNRILAAAVVPGLMIALYSMNSMGIGELCIDPLVFGPCILLAMVCAFSLASNFNGSNDIENPEQQSNYIKLGKRAGLGLATLVFILIPMFFPCTMSKESPAPAKLGDPTIEEKSLHEIEVKTNGPIPTVEQTSDTILKK